jgi:hypothetical protein
MTNSQQTIKLDLSSLLTETSAHSDNKYTSSALELLLNGDVDQSGAGLFSAVGAAVKKGAQQLGPAIKAAGKDVIQDAVRSASPLANRGREAARSAVGSVSNAIKTSPERLRAVGNQVSNVVRTSPERVRAVGNQVSDAVRNTPALLRAAVGNTNQAGALSDTSSAPVDRDQDALILIQNRLTNIEKDIKQLLELLQSNQQYV